MTGTGPDLFTRGRTMNIAKDDNDASPAQPALAVAIEDDGKKRKKDDKGKKGKKARKAAAAASAAAGEDGAVASQSAALKGKAYDKELAKLHEKLVTLQEWVKHKGLKVCIVFEGRDGAGKGGAIKAITERVSPRVFRTVALPAPTDREKSQMYM
jgi:polyphosphate kinase 2 (PPK2 family)